MNDSLEALLKTVKAQIGSGEIEEAIAALTLIDEKFSLQIGDELLIQSARYTKNERERNRIDTRDYQTTSSQVTASLLDLIKSAKPRQASGTTPQPTPPRTAPSTGPAKLVVLYHIDDAAAALKLEMQLKILTRAGKLEIHFQQKTPAPGSDLIAAARSAIDGARLVSVLATESFFFDDANFNLVEYAKGLQKPIVPVLVKSFSLDGSGIEGLRGLPSNNKFIDQWPNVDSAWLDIANGLRAVLVPGS